MNCKTHSWTERKFANEFTLELPATHRWFHCDPRRETDWTSELKRKLICERAAASRARPTSTVLSAVWGIVFPGRNPHCPARATTCHVNCDNGGDKNARLSNGFSHPSRQSVALLKFVAPFQSRVQQAQVLPNGHIAIIDLISLSQGDLGFLESPQLKPSPCKDAPSREGVPRA